MTTVLICEDQAQLRGDLIQTLRRVDGLCRVQRVEHDDLVRHFTIWREDCLVVVGSSRGRLAADTVADLLAVEPRATVLAVGASGEDDAVLNTITVGVNGFVRWDAMSATLLMVMAHVVAASNNPQPAIVHRDTGQPHQLTSRELQVLVGMSEGLSNGGIGRQLSLKESSVKSHAHRIFAKIGVRDRAHAVAYGFRNGLLS